MVPDAAAPVQDTAVRETSAGVPVPAEARAVSVNPAPGREEGGPGEHFGGRRPLLRERAAAVVDVEDGNVVAYCVDGLVLDVPARSIPALADWKLTKRGFGRWARIYRPAQGSQRACVQLCSPSWHALGTRHWGEAGQLPPAELARLLGTFASRVMTSRGSTAVTGLELMTALHPPTRASEPDANGVRHSVHNPGSLGKDPVDPAPCEAPDGHPLLAGLPRFHRRSPAEVLAEEAYDWARPLTGAECTRRFLVGIDVNMAFAAGANGMVVGLGAPTHERRLSRHWLASRPLHARREDRAGPRPS